MPTSVRNLYSLRLQKQTDYVRGNIYRSMSLTQVGNNLNEDTLLLLKHKGIKYSEEIIDFATVIAYAFTQYSLKSGLKDLGVKGETAVTEDLYQLHIRDTFFPKLSKHLTK